MDYVVQSAEKYRSLTKTIDTKLKEKKTGLSAENFFDGFINVRGSRIGIHHSQDLADGRRQILDLLSLTRTGVYRGIRGRASREDPGDSR